MTSLSVRIKDKVGTVIFPKKGVPLLDPKSVGQALEKVKNNTEEVQLYFPGADCPNSACLGVIKTFLIDYLVSSGGRVTLIFKYKEVKSTTFEPSIEIFRRRMAQAGIPEQCLVTRIGEV